MTKITKPIIRLDMTENAYFIMSVCRKAALKNGMDWEKIHKEMTAGNYDDLLTTVENYFEVE